MCHKADRSGTTDLRTVLGLIRTEIPQFVLDDGSAKRAAVLLVREREYSFCDGIGRVEDIVAEVTEGRPVNGIRSRLALHIHGKLSGTTLRGIKLVGNDLELRDGIAAKLSLSEAGVRTIRGHLLAVKVELLTTSVQRAQRGVIGDSVPADAWNQGSEVHVITAVEWNFLESFGVDVSGYLRGCGVDGRDIIGHGYGGGRTCQRQLKAHIHRLTHQEGEFLDRRGKSRGLGSYCVVGGGNARKLKVAVFVRNCLVAGTVRVQSHNGRRGYSSALNINDLPRNDRLLRARDPAHHKDGEQCESYAASHYCLQKIVDANSSAKRVQVYHDQWPN